MDIRVWFWSSTARVLVIHSRPVLEIFVLFILLFTISAQLIFPRVSRLALGLDSSCKSLFTPCSSGVLLTFCSGVFFSVSLLAVFILSSRGILIKRVFGTGWRSFIQTSLYLELFVYLAFCFFIHNVRQTSSCFSASNFGSVF